MSLLVSNDLNFPHLEIEPSITFYCYNIITSIDCADGAITDNSLIISKGRRSAHLSGAPTFV